MKQRIDNITVIAFYQNEIFLKNGKPPNEVPTTIGELIEWIDNNTDAWEIKDDGHVCAYNAGGQPIANCWCAELIDALVSLCLKIKEKE